MAANTAISWATHSWNPWVGCEKIGPACDHCYAEAWAKRAGTPGLWEGDRRRTKTWGEPLKFNKAALASGRRDSIFACSLADWFDNHPAVAPIRADAWKVVRVCQDVDWYLVTKRIPNVLKMLPPDWSQEHFGHVVIIITVVTQAEVDRDVPRLLALKRNYPWLRVGLSIEPLLEAVDLSIVAAGPFSDARVCRIVNPLSGDEGHTGPCGVSWTGRRGPRLDWVIVGGESGGHARPMNPAWARALRDQCLAAKVPFHFKQHGEFLDGARVGTAKSGRMLDGVIHDAGPRAISA